MIWEMFCNLDIVEKAEDVENIQVEEVNFVTSDSDTVDVVPVARLEAFRALKFVGQIGRF